MIVADVFMGESDDKGGDGKGATSDKDVKLLELHEEGKTSGLVEPVPSQLNRVAAKPKRSPSVKGLSDKQNKSAPPEKPKRSNSRSSSGQVAASRSASARSTNNQRGKRAVGEEKLLSQLSGRNEAAKASRNRQASIIQSKPTSTLPDSSGNEKVQENSKAAKLANSGSVQLVVLARKGSNLGEVLCQPNTCIKGVVPAGSNLPDLSGTANKISEFKVRGGYPSTDECALYAYFPAAKLLFMSVHLNGSRDVDLPKFEYDNRQFQKLNSISCAADRLVHRAREQLENDEDCTDDVGRVDSGRDLGVALVLMGEFKHQSQLKGTKLGDNCEPPLGRHPPLFQGVFDAMSVSALTVSPIKEEALSIKEEGTKPSESNHILFRDMHYFFADSKVSESMVPTSPKSFDEASLVRSHSESKVGDRYYFPATALFTVPGASNDKLSQNSSMEGGQKSDAPQSTTPFTELSPSAVEADPDTPPPLFEGSLLKQRFEVSRLYKTPWKLRFLRLYPDRLEYGKWNRKNRKSKHYGTLMLRKGSPLYLNSTLEVVVSDRDATSPRTITLKVQPSDTRLSDKLEDQSEGNSSSESRPWITCIFQDDPMDQKQKGAKFLAALLAVQEKLKSAGQSEDTRIQNRKQALKETESFVYTPGSVLGIAI